MSGRGPAPAEGIVTVLLSGGMDSLACLHYFRKAGRRAEGLFIDYGHAAAAREKAAARRIARHFGVPLSVVRLGGASPDIAASGFIQGRNMAFLLLGLMNSRAETGAVALGIHHGTPYADCSPRFVVLAQKVFDLYTGGRVRVEAPFASWDKVDIAIYCLKERLPRALSYSCELGLDQPCGRCKSCRDLIALDGPAGYRAPSGRP